MVSSDWKQNGGEVEEGDENAALEKLRTNENVMQMELENNDDGVPQINRRYEMDIDKRWAWVVLAATFLTFFTMQGQVLTSNIYFVIYLETFQQPRSVTSFVGAAYTAAINLTGPLASILLRKIGPRAVLMIGGVFLAVGMGCISTSQSIVDVIIFSGIIRGVGGGLVMCGCAAALSKYFRKRLFVATGIMYSSASIGLMTIGLLTEYIISYYGWRGSMLIQAGLALQIVLFGALVFRLPKEPPPQQAQSSISGATSGPVKRTTIRQYAGDIRFWLVSASTTLFFMFTATIILYWKDIILVKEHFKVAVVAMAVGSTIGRATAGFISNKVPPPIHNAILGVCAAFSVMGFLVADRVWIVAVQNLAWGLFNGQQTVVDRLQLIWVFGRREMPIVLGYTLFFVGVGGFAAPPIAGYLTDLTGNYLVTLSLTAAYLIVSAGISISLYIIHKKKIAEEKNVYTINIEGANNKCENEICLSGTNKTTST